MKTVSLLKFGGHLVEFAPQTSHGESWLSPSNKRTISNAGWALGLSVALWAGHVDATEVEGLSEAEIGGYFTTTEIFLDTELERDSNATLTAPLPSFQTKQASPRRRIILDLIRMIGQGIWELVRDTRIIAVGQPAVIHALPQGITEPRHLQYWEVARPRHYKTTFTSGLGYDAVRFRFDIYYSYNGAYQGTGQYLANVSVQPVSLWVAETHSFNQSSRALSAVNLASAQYPVSGLQIVSEWNAAFIGTTPALGSTCVFLSGAGRADLCDDL